MLIANACVYFEQISLGLVLAILTYLSLFVFLWTLLVVVPFGGLLAAIIVWLFVVYHNILIDDNCECQDYTFCKNPN